MFVVENAKGSNFFLRFFKKIGVKLPNTIKAFVFCDIVTDRTWFWSSSPRFLSPAKKNAWAIYPKPWSIYPKAWVRQTKLSRDKGKTCGKPRIAPFYAVMRGLRHFAVATNAHLNRNGQRTKAFWNSKRQGAPPTGASCSSERGRGCFSPLCYLFPSRRGRELLKNKNYMFSFSPLPSKH